MRRDVATHCGTSLRFRVDPRLVPAAKAARRLGLTREQFVAALPALLLEGFPRACTVTGNFDLHAIEVWQDQRSGLVHGQKIEDHEAIMRARLEGLG